MFERLQRETTQEENEKVRTEKKNEKKKKRKRKRKDQLTQVLGNGRRKERARKGKLCGGLGRRYDLMTRRL
jgi:hypothetical protein